jgi:hypothetical protein
MMETWRHRGVIMLCHLGYKICRPACLWRGSQFYLQHQAMCVCANGDLQRRQRVCIERYATKMALVGSRLAVRLLRIITRPAEFFNFLFQARCYVHSTETAGLWYIIVQAQPLHINGPWMIIEGSKLRTSIGVRVQVSDLRDHK